MTAPKLAGRIAALVGDARKAVAALAAGATAATGAGLLTNSTGVLIGGLCASLGAALAAYQARDPRIPTK